MTDDLELVDRGDLTVDGVDVGDRLVSFTALVPEPGPGQQVLAVSDRLAASLRTRYPRAVRHDAADLDDAAGSAGLLVVDTSLVELDSVRPLLAPDGVLVTLGRRGQYAVYPTLERPEEVWRRPWPLPEASGLGVNRQLRRNLGLAASSFRGTPFLSVEGAGPSLVERVAADLSDALHEEFRLVGVTCAGHTLLRLRGADSGRDVAVRISLTGPAPTSIDVADLLTDVPRAADFVPEPIARGTTAGFSWVAMRWVPERRTPVLHTLRRSRAIWLLAEQLAETLAEVQTGVVDESWARRWAGLAPIVPAAAQAEFATMLAALPLGTPTGWSHGDPWEGNILVDRPQGVVVDWDNAAPDAPLGLDHVLVAALRSARENGLGVAQACADLVDEPELLPRAVAGRPWVEWDREARVAIALSAYLLHLRNRSIVDLGHEGLVADLATLRELGRPAAPAAPAGRSGGATRGVAWLGLGAGVVKASQTAVLLILAAILAPSALGLIAIGSLIVNMTTAISDFGSSTALVHWRGNAERAARSALTVALGFGLTITVAGWLLAPALSEAFGAGSAGAAVIRGLLLTVPIDGITGVSRELLRRDMRFAKRVLPDMVSALAGLGVSLALAFNGVGVMSLVVGQIVQSSVALAMNWMMRAPVLPGWNRSDVSGLVKYGRNLAGANLLTLLMLNVDYLIVARVLGPTQLGYYSLAFRLAYMPYLLITVVIAGAAFPYICRLDGAAAGRAAGSVMALTLTAVAPMYVGMILLADQIQILGTKWAPAVPVLHWLAAYGLALCVVQLCLSPLNAIGRPGDSFVLTLVHLALLTALLVALTGRGTQWVGIAQLAAAGAVAITALALMRRRMAGFDLAAVLGQLLPMALGIAAMIVTILVCQSVAPSSRVSVLGLVVIGTLAIAAYALPVWLLSKGRVRAANELLRGAS